jgi:hypothetical protein
MKARWQVLAKRRMDAKWNAVRPSMTATSRSSPSVTITGLPAGIRHAPAWGNTMAWAMP